MAHHENKLDTLYQCNRQFIDIADGNLVAINAAGGGSSANSMSRTFTNGEFVPIAVTVRMMGLLNVTRTGGGNKNIDLGGRLQINTGSFTTGQSIHAYRFHDVMPDPGIGQGVTMQGWVQGTFIIPAGASRTITSYVITSDISGGFNFTTAPNGFQAFGVDCVVEYPIGAFSITIV